MTPEVPEEKFVDFAEIDSVEVGCLGFYNQ